MKILSVNNYQNKQNFQARSFAITSEEIGVTEIAGEKLGEIFWDSDITGGKRCHVVRLLEDITDKILAAFYVDDKSDVRILYQSLHETVNVVKTTDGERILFSYFRKKPQCYEEKVLPTVGVKR